MRGALPTRRFLIYLVFMVSGATALVYQVLWSRWLGLVFGNTTASISVVLGSFMLGLALGSWASGRLLRRPLRPLRAYGLLELGIGLFAMGFPWISTLVERAYLHLVSVDTAPALSLGVRASFAFLLLLVPTTLMGGTLPLLTEFLGRHAARSTNWTVGVLYAANTFGAALGVLAAGFVLIELVGVRATNLLAAAGNMTIALVALRFSAASEARAEAASPPPGLPPMEATTAVPALAVLATSGAAAMGCEVLWTRTLETLVGNSSYALSMIVLLYLLGIAAGSFTVSRYVTRMKGLPLWLAFTQWGAGLWILFAIFLFQRAIEGMAPLRGTLVSMPVLFAGFGEVMALLLPLSVLSGAVFPIATRILHPEAAPRGAIIARAAAWNTLGSVLGCLVAGLVVAPRLDYFDALRLLALVYGAVGLATVLVDRRTGAWFRSIAWFAAVAGGVTGVGLAWAQLASSESYVRRVEATHPSHQVVFHEPGLQGVTTVLKERATPLASVLLVNGMGMTVKVTETKLMAHLPLLLHPNPTDTLVICFGMGTTYRSALSHGGNVTVVELVGEVFDAFGHFHADAAAIRAHPRGRMVVDDGRNFLQLARDRYDVITIDPPPPIDAAGVNHLYSLEFLELAKRRLKPGGIMAHWIPFPGRMAGVDDEEMFDSLLRTFRAAFPHVVAQPGWHRIGLHVLGSSQPIDVSPARLDRRLERREVAADVREWNDVPAGYFARVAKLPPELARGGLVTDDRPSLEFYLIRTWARGGRKTFLYSFW